MPKYIVSALGDEFFLPDDNIFFLNDLQGVTYIRSVLATPPSSHVFTQSLVTLLYCIGPCHFII